MNPKRTLLVVLVLVGIWVWWSMVLDERRGDAVEAERAESAAQAAQANVFVPTMMEDEALLIVSEANGVLTYYGDPTHPDRSESRSRHIRRFMLALIDDRAASACAPSVSDAGAVPGPYSSEIIPISVALTVPTVDGVEGFVAALIDHPAIVVQSIAMETASVSGAGASEALAVATCSGFSVQAAFDLYGASVPPAPLDGAVPDG